MEQDRKNRRGAAVGIRAEVLRYRTAAQPRQVKPYLPVAISLLLLAGGIGTGAYLLGKRDVVLSQATRPTAALPSVAAPAIPAVPSVAPAATSHSGGAFPAPELATPTGQPVSVSAPVQPSASKPAGKPAAAAAKPGRYEAAAKPQAKAPRREGTENLQGAMPDIAISGIAFQDERSLRRAVLNGALVGEGAEVAGARVVEIKENKVRMSRGGEVFDIVFSSGFQSR